MGCNHSPKLAWMGAQNCDLLKRCVDEGRKFGRLPRAYQCSPNDGPCTPSSSDSSFTPSLIACFFSYAHHAKTKIKTTSSSSLIFSMAYPARSQPFSSLSASSSPGPTQCIGNRCKTKCVLTLVS